MNVFMYIPYIISLALIAIGCVYYAKNKTSKKASSSIKLFAGISIAALGCGGLLGLYLPIQIGDQDPTGEWIGFVLLVIVGIWALLRAESSAFSENGKKTKETLSFGMLSLLSLLVGVIAALCSRMFLIS